MARVHERILRTKCQRSARVRGRKSRQKILVNCRWSGIVISGVLGVLIRKDGLILLVPFVSEGVRASYCEDSSYFSV